MATFKWDFSATCASVDLRFGRARMNGCMPCASSRRSTTDACMARMQAAGQQLCAQPDKSWPSRQVVARLRCAMQRLARSRTSKIAGRATGLFVRPLASARRGIALHGGPKSSRHGPWRGGCGKMYSSRSSVFLPRAQRARKFCAKWWSILTDLHRCLMHFAYFLGVPVQISRK